MTAQLDIYGLQRPKANIPGIGRAGGVLAPFPLEAAASSAKNCLNSAYRRRGNEQALEANGHTHCNTQQ